MTRVIGVRFRTAGKIYFFDPMHYEIKRGDHVIVETARGIEFGTVVSGITEVEDEKVVQPLKPVLRLATERDLEQEANNKVKEKEAFKVCLEKIRAHGLEMKLIDAEYTFDNNKVLFYFTADGRIDFRELVKDLAGVFKTRIELRQVGVRDETKIVGGIGICGRSLCCHSYLSDFIPVSIKMAKEQNLSLNPTKISGVCGRLMCCLKNEEETYEDLNRRLPGIGDYITTEDGMRGVVQSVNVLRQLVKVVVEEGDEKEIKEYPVEELHFRRKHSKKERMALSKEELEELERLEKEERQEKQEAAGQQEGKGRGRQNGEQRHDGSARGGQENERRRENHSRQDGDQRRERRDRQYGEQKGDFGDRQRGEQKGDYRNRQRGEQKGDYRSRQRGEQRNDFRDRQNGEQRNDFRDRQHGEQRNDFRDHQNGEQRNDSRDRQNGEQRNDFRDRQHGEQRNDFRNRQHGDQRRENRERQEGGWNRGGKPRSGEEQGSGQRQGARNRQNRRRDDRPRQEGQAAQHAEHAKEQ